MITPFNRLVLAAAMLHPLAGLTTAADAPAAGFYKQPPLFSTAPDVKVSSTLVSRFGPVGIGIELIQPAFGMRIGNVEKGSPAEATGKLKPGQLIETINGQKLANIDPRIQLGNLITAAEASDGAIRLMVKDTPEAAAQEVVVQIPALGAYSATWPLHCPKSDKIVRGVADYLAKPDANKGIGGVGMLFLLSTGEERDLAPVKEWVHGLAAKPAPKYAWHLGYGGIPLCEYYLRTGDPAVLPVIQSWVVSAAKAEYLDAWAGRGGVTAVDYGNGHLNAGGTAVLTFLLLAKECGADVNESLLQRTLRHFFRFAGRGVNPYGDDRPETSFVDNGKNGNLAFAMAAAASLAPDGEQSIYAAARDICAMSSFYTTTYMLHGHTGGGIGEGWRSPAMGLLCAKKPAQYREFMDGRRWHYELSRRYTGAFGIVGGSDGGKVGGYDSEEWGSAYALTYTIPRRTLRIAGASSKFAKTHKLPARPWGTAADDTFVSLDSVPDAGGQRLDLSGETLAKDSAKPLIEGLLTMGDVEDDVLRRLMRHPDYLVRNLAAKNAVGLKFNYMWNQGGARTRPALIQEWLRTPDPRVRRAALGALAAHLPGEKPELFLTPEVFASAIALLRDPAESWWIKDAALQLVGRAQADWIAPHVDLLTSYLRHEEQWLQNAALVALTPVVADARCYRKVLPAIGELLRTCQRVSTIGPVRRGALPAKLAAASPEVRKLAAETLKGAYAEYAGVKVAEGGQNISSVYDAHKNLIAGYLTGIEGGYDVLYEIAKQESPKDPLPHREIFLAADPEKFGPKLKEALAPIIREQLIYEFIGRNRAHLLAETDPAKPSYGPDRSIDGLVALYRKIGVSAYDWRVFGPDLKDATWDYHTFDPPEKQVYDLSPWRYRTVTYPAGMENWFAPGFDPAQAGWKKGQSPFGQLEGQLVTDVVERRNPDCRATGPMRTLWDKEVLLVRGTFTFPPLKTGHLYRVRAESGQHVGSGDGYRLYLNGKLLGEEKTGVGRREGGKPRGFVVNGAFAAEFAKGPVTIDATSFLRYGDRAVVTMPPVPRGLLAVWVEEMKIPAIDGAALRRSATLIPMLSAAWQEKQDPENRELQTTDDQFRYDGTFTANPKLIGNWTAVDVVPAIEGFVPVDANPADAAAKKAASADANKRAEAAKRAPIKSVDFKQDGLTGTETLIWSGDTLMDLQRFQALKMTMKTLGGAEYLFVEAGGFSEKNPAGWKSPLIVMKRTGT